ncbi:MAG: adenylosuccinate synthase [Candidatus Omnitrophica bacterium]|nr:adenylosuccinate synthase [Candidatus Omnitrophota bacterium]
MVTVIVGTQWGDEGKGKIIDFLAPQHDIVARYQGGANAGHTVMYNNKKFVFHLIPSGILHPKVVGALGNGVVLDPVSFFQEIENLEKEKIKFKSRLFIAENAHITLPYHKMLDHVEDKKKGKDKIGTTGRGIGATYTDKYGRTGIRVIDFLDSEVFINKLKTNLELKNYLLKEYYNEKEFIIEKIIDEYQPYRVKMQPFVRNVSLYLNEEIDNGKKILAEGAQGTFLDIDFGTYPYVTASNPVSAGACTGLGIGPKKITHVLGVAKAYTTRVGMGPFPTELTGEINDKLRQAGNEFGATTGRPRRCGWFDSVLVRFASKINSLDELIITKLDVLSGLGKIRVGFEYYYNDKKIKDYPLDMRIFSNAKVEYRECDGWMENINTVTRYKDLPRNAKKYLGIIEELVETKISYVSVGSDREQIIKM